jgi:aromatic ring-opening dioxygenase catalytic subunit (LigB family)
MSELPTLYIAHGGGPCFFMQWDPPHMWDRMAAWLRGLAATLAQRPRAIVVISAHWEAREFCVTSSAHPPLIYDYYGFPPHTYQLRYDAPGEPQLAQQVSELLAAAKLPCHEDARRGFDHGVFIPFKLIYPDADVPIVQLSLRAGLDSAVHLAAGRALEPLRSQGILIVGSGMSFHNLRAFGGPTQEASERFDEWLGNAVAAPESSARDGQLLNWSQAPYARFAHPREEHLLPLMVAAGAAGHGRGRRIFSDNVLGTTVSAFQFESAA